MHLQDDEVEDEVEHEVEKCEDVGCRMANAVDGAKDVKRCWL